MDDTTLKMCSLAFALGTLCSLLSGNSIGVALEHGGLPFRILAPPNPATLRQLKDDAIERWENLRNPGKAWEEHQRFEEINDHLTNQVGRVCPRCPHPNWRIKGN